MTNPDLTHLILVVDCSYSMTSIKAEMNSAIQALLVDQAAQPGQCSVSVLAFSDQTYWVVSAQDARSLVRSDFVQPTGNTALLDGLGRAINDMGKKFANTPEDQRPGTVIVAVVTDGMENASREFTTEVVKGLVQEQSEHWHWTFTFLGANIDAWAVAQNLGFNRAHTMTFAPAAGGVQNSVGAASMLVTATRNGTAYSYTDDDRNAAMEN